MDQSGGFDMVANFRAVLLSSLCALGIGANASAEISGDVIRIGFLSDLSGPYADADGPGSAEAIRMAIADVGGSINGKPIEFVFADHFNKSDVASEKAREWFDRHGVDMLVSGGSSGATIALAKLAEEKKRVYVAVGTTAIRLTMKTALRIPCIMFMTLWRWHAAQDRRS